MDANDNTDSQAYLQTTDSDSAIPPLIKILTDKDSKARVRATRALKNIGTEAAVTALLQVLSQRLSRFQVD